MNCKCFRDVSVNTFGYFYRACGDVSTRVSAADGWAHFTNSSGNESKYKVLSDVTTYSRGQQLCWRLGGHLAHINSLEEQLFLEHFLKVWMSAF